MTGSETPKKKGGRPRLYPGTEKRPTLTFRVRDRMHEQISKAAEESGRSLSEEIERRLDKSFSDPEIIYRTSEQAIRDVVDRMMSDTYKEFGGYEGYTIGKWLGQTFANRLTEIESEFTLGDDGPWYRDEEKIKYLHLKLDSIGVSLVDALAGKMRSEHPTLQELASRFGIRTAGLSEVEVQQKLADHFTTLSKDSEAAHGKQPED